MTGKKKKLRKMGRWEIYEYQEMIRAIQHILRDTDIGHREVALRFPKKGEAGVILVPDTNPTVVNALGSVRAVLSSAYDELTQKEKGEPK